jgi:acetyl esterase
VITLNLAGNLVRSARGAAESGATSVQHHLFTTMMGLPEPVQRRIVGKPVVVDGHTLATDTQLMLMLQKVVREPAPETLPVPEAREAIARQTAMVGGRPPVGSIREVTVAGMPARLYIPSTATGDDPLLVFLHGGGFIYGDVDSYDPPCRFLAEQSGVRVLSVDYRLAPEAPFPAACEDAVAAFRWAKEHAVELGADPVRIGVGGDSAGGNLAANVALDVTTDCAFQLLVYPVTKLEHDTKSAELFAEGYYLTSGFIEVAGTNYVSEDTDRTDRRLMLLEADIPEGVAPAYVCTAGFDPLRDEGEAYAEHLRAAGVKVELRRFESQIHSFFNAVGVGRSAPAAVAEVAAALRAGLA